MSNESGRGLLNFRQFLKKNTTNVKMAGNLLISQLLLVVVTLNGVISIRTIPQHMCQATDESREEGCLKTPQDGYGHTRHMGPLMATDFDVKYILYKGEDKEYTFTYDNFNSSQVNFILGAPLKVLIHGFLNSGKTTFPVNIRQAYLKRMKNHPDEQYNVLVYDWGDGACAAILNIPAPYKNAVENVKEAGKKLGDMLVKLHNLKLMDVSTEVHLIGHSLGSHVAGQAARQIYEKVGKIINRVSALDPAGPLFWRNKLFLGPKQPFPRLHRNRVHFLDVYHTSRAFGSNEEMGDVDFFVNGGRDQDSCKLEFKVPIFGWKIPIPVFDIFLQVCSHNYATEIYAKSINDESMLGCTGCYSYSEFLENKCDCEDKPILGEFVVKEMIEDYPIASGIAFVRTPKDTSVGSNYMQMLKDNGIFGLLIKGWQVLCFRS